jgi:hypothetical protein
MRTITRIVTVTGMIVASALATAANVVKIGLVAADNFHGDAARPVRGARIAVFNILDAIERALRVLRHDCR